MLMYKLHQDVGMRVAVQSVFREDCFVVFQIQVQHVDSKRVLAKAHEEEMAKSSGGNMMTTTVYSHCGFGRVD